MPRNTVRERLRVIGGLLRDLIRRRKANDARDATLLNRDDSFVEWLATAGHRVQVKSARSGQLDFAQQCALAGWLGVPLGTSVVSNSDINRGLDQHLHPALFRRIADGDEDTGEHLVALV